MTTAYTSLLGLALPVTGELSGTWGDTVNTAITSLLDSAVAGTTSITVDADITLTTTTGASNEARQAIILWNPASGTTTRNITAPAQSKLYTVINASGGTQSIVIRGAGPTTGVTIAKGEAAMVAWNGSDFVKVSSSGGAITFTDLTVTGNTILGDAAADTLTVNATSTFAAPVNFQGLVKLPSTGRSAAAALTVTAPAFLYGVASTYTDTTSSGTVGAMAPFYSIAQPTLSTSNVTTYTNAATLYIANAPAAGGSATITNPYALYVAAGKSYFGGDVVYAGGINLNGNVTVGDSSSDTLTVNSTITSNLIFTDNTYDIGASGATRPRSLYLATKADATVDGVGQILLTPSGYRVSSRATLLVKTLTNNPAEIDLLNTNGGLNYGWQISSRDGTTPSLDFYANNNNVFTNRLTLTSSSAVFNEDGNDYDFRVESDTNTHALFVDAGSSLVGINNSTPAYPLDILGTADTTLRVQTSGTTNAASLILQAGNGTSSAKYSYARFVNNDTTPIDWRLGTYGTNNLSLHNATSGNTLFSFGTDGTLTANSQSGTTVFNESGNDVDFRVESDLNTHMLFVDGGNDAVGIGMVPLTTFGNRLSLEIGGATVANLSLQSAISETLYNFYLDGSGTSKYSTTGPAAFISFNNAVSSGWSFQAVTSGTANANIGSFTDLFALGLNGTVFNESGADIDFRVESDNNTHMLFVDAGNDAVSIGTSSVENWYQRVIQGPSWGITELLGVDQTGWATGCYQDAYGYTTNWKFRGSYPASLYTQTADHTFFITASTRGPGNPITWRNVLALSDTAAVFNEDSNDIDFRVESNDTTHMLFVDAGTNRVNVGTSSAYSSVFTTYATGAYSGGDVNAMFVNPSGRPTIRLRSEASDACEIFFDTGGGVAWDISCRSVGEGKPMLWFPAAATPSYASVGAQVMTLTQTGNLTIAGALAKGSGSFLIEHPLPALAETHNLVHSFVEAPQADLYYRGKVALVNGKAVVNIDEAAGMTDGTFVLLNREVQCFTSNETDWDAVRGFVSGNILTIECQNPASTATVSWLVVGERQDKHMYDTDWTDENGKVIVEPIKPPPIEPPTFNR